MRRWLAALLGLLAVVAGGCARSAAEPGPSGVFDVGGGRKLFLDCQGQGSPTVFIVPGKGSYAEAWNVVVPLDDPIRSSPYDIIAQAKFVPSPDAVQPTVAKTTQVCAYDRPNTRPDGADRSTDVPQPHSVQQDVDDVVTLINASRSCPRLWCSLPTPMAVDCSISSRVRVRSLVAGLVMVDPDVGIPGDLGSPAQNAAFERDSMTPPEPGDETVLLGDAIALDQKSRRRCHVFPRSCSAPTSSAARGLTPDNYTLAQIHEANNMLAAALGTTNIFSTGSGHNMMLYQPKFVADNIIDIVERVREG